MQIGIGFERVLIFICSFSMVAHIVTCLWVFSSQFSAEGEDNWITNGDYEGLPKSDQYLIALYFTITTITTVGYGDILATSSIEKIFCILIMLTGVIGFSFATGVLTSIIQNYDAHDSRY